MQIALKLTLSLRTTRSQNEKLTKNQVHL